MFSKRIYVLTYNTIEKCKTFFSRYKNVNSLLGATQVSNRQIEFTQQKTSHQYDSNYTKYMKKLVYSASISAGIYMTIFLLKKDSNNWIPSVYAASSIKKPNVDNFINKQGSDIKKDIRRTHNFIADAAEKITDGVVFITVQDNNRRDYNGKPLLVSNGSGFVVESDGLIMTNAHVVGNKPRASIIVVKLSDGREFEGVIEELDAMSDLALVRIKCDTLNSVSLGLSSDLRPGEFVVALGSPLSLSNSITSGVVSSVGRHSHELGLRGPAVQYIQTDAAITFGNSGGPLINLDGEVIGINSMKVTPGISFAIPIDYAKEFLMKAKKKQEFMSKRKSETRKTKRRRYLGITMFGLTREIILELQQRPDFGKSIPPNLTHGILVWKVVVGSPAYYAGLSPGDIITHMNGKKISSISQAYELLEAHCDLDMVVIRGGQRYALTVAPEE